MSSTLIVFIYLQELLNLLTLEHCPEIKAKKAFIPETTKETKF
jgi:hypothetical protein